MAIKYFDANALIVNRFPEKIQCELSSVTLKSETRERSSTSISLGAGGIVRFVDSDITLMTFKILRYMANVG